MSDRITVTMLGTSKSGKTTYLLGMYATLSAGRTASSSTRTTQTSTSISPRAGMR
jgi:hypothetical protein